MARELLAVTVLAIASVVLVAGSGRPSSSTSADENVEQVRSMPSRRRRDGGQQGTFQIVADRGGDGQRSWTVRRQMSTGRAGNASYGGSSTESRLTVDQWRSRERSVITITSPVLSVEVCMGIGLGVALGIGLLMAMRLTYWTGNGNGMGMIPREWVGGNGNNTTHSHTPLLISNRNSFVWPVTYLLTLFIAHL